MAPTKADIAPWKWVGTTKPEEVTLNEIYQSYRLRGPGVQRCPFRCVRNCRKNPYCLWGLGEKAWILNGADDNSDEDTNPEFRKEDDFVGIINLGTTCYVNALLQLWFHNPIIRPAILSWRPSYITNGIKYQPLCLMGQLQAMFARMKMSKRSAIDPTTLIEYLHLNTGEQQDAQEFAKLFMSVLSTLAEEDNVGKELNRAFEGTSKYEMECKVCGTKYGTDEKFTELDLCVKDVKDTSASFAKLFTEEELSGENQYLCQNCCNKTDAIRRFQLLNLPPVLNIQLLRFIYDKDTRRKKKVSTLYCFPEILDMTRYVQFGGLEKVGGRQYVYQLTGYLVHNGNSASSGHYVAHIRDIRTGAWLIFNDEAVSEQKTSGKSKIEEDYTSKSEKTGEYKSTGAYMLVYTHCNLSASPPVDPEIPSYLKQLITDEDSLFEMEFQITKKEREMKAQYFDEKKNCIDKLYTLLVPDKQPVVLITNKENQDSGDTNVACKTHSNENSLKKGKEQDLSLSRKGKDRTKNFKLSKQLAINKSSIYEDCYTIDLMDFVPYTWLISWLSHHSETVPVLSTQEIRCLHNKLVLPLGLACAAYKAIPSIIADILYVRYGDNSSRLSGTEALCFQCVVIQCRILRSINDLDAHAKQVHELSTTCLKNFDKYRKFSNTIAYSDSFWEDKFWVSKNSLRKWKGWARSSISPQNFESEEVTEVLEPAGPFFNEDIRCCHGNLSLDESLRRPVCIETWSILEKYFPNCFTANAQVNTPCKTCEDLKAHNLSVVFENKRFAEKVKETLSDLIRNKNRPNLAIPGLFYFVSEEFIRRVASFLRNPEKNEIPITVGNVVLLCQHKMFKYPVNLVEELRCSRSQVSSFDLEDSKLNRWFLVKQEEWALIRDLFSVDFDIKVFVTSNNVKEHDYAYSPELCPECSVEWYSEARAELCHFIDETVYFKLYDEEHASESTNKFCVIPEDDDDTGLKILPPLSKKKKTDESIRRSCRSRHGKREKKVKISSNDTVKKLKHSLVKALGFQFLASEINLYYENSSLLDETATVSSVGIVPGSNILYKTQICNEMEVSMETDSFHEPETGFAGTMLQLRLDDTKSKISSQPPEKARSNFSNNLYGETKMLSQNLTSSSSDSN